MTSAYGRTALGGAALRVLALRVLALWVVTAQPALAVSLGDMAEKAAADLDAVPGLPA